MAIERNARTNKHQTENNKNELNYVLKMKTFETISMNVNDSETEL